MVVTTKINLIRDYFQKGKEFSFQLNDTKSFDLFIQSCDPKTLPVIMEGVSAGFACQSFINPSGIDLWLAFYKKYMHHAKHLCIGLGWAINESDNSLELLEQINPVWRWKVVDGYGYRAGIFQRRKIQRSQTPPEQVSQEWVSAFYQGLGRSLWYTSQGNVERLIKSIEMYPEKASLDLWRGVGVAITFVGLIDSQSLKLLSKINTNSLNSLKQGVALVLSSISKKNKQTPDLERIGNFFFDDWKKTIGFTEIIKSKLNENGTNYLLLIEQHSTSW